MVSNADIILDKGFGPLRHKIDNKTIVALSRHASKHCKDINRCFDTKHRGMSMDSFLGSGPIPDVIADSTRFLQNRFGAENLLVFNFRKHGFTAVNPCYNVITVHNHCSEDRPWTETKANIKRVDNFKIHGRVSVKPTIWPCNSTARI